MDVRVGTEGWAPKNWCLQTVFLEKILGSPFDCKEIEPVNPKGNQPWIFIVGTDAEAPILWPPDVKSWLIGKEPDAGKDWRQEEKRVTEDEVFGWHLWLSGHESEQAPGDAEGQGSLVCCSPWGHKESDTTERLNKNIFHSWCPKFRLSVLIGRCFCYCSCWVFWVSSLTDCVNLRSFLVPPYATPSTLKAPDQQEGAHCALSCSRALMSRAPSTCPHWSWS